MIDFIKKLFIRPKYKPMGQSRPCLAETLLERSASHDLGSKMKMIFALAALEVARTSKINFINQILSASVRYGSHALRILDFKYFQIIIYDMMQHHMKPKPNMLEAYTINIQ
jgi:hypothetical protein